MTKNYFYILLIAAFALSCEKEFNDTPFSQEEQQIKHLLSVPETLSIQENRVILKTILYRDYMPGIVGQNNPNLLCIHKLTNINNNKIQGDIELKKQYIIKDQEVWISDFDEVRDYNENYLEGVVRSDLQLTENDVVDVICSFTYKGKSYKIIAKSQLVTAVW